MNQNATENRISHRLRRTSGASSPKAFPLSFFSPASASFSSSVSMAATSAASLFSRTVSTSTITEIAISSDTARNSIV